MHGVDAFWGCIVGMHGGAAWWGYMMRMHGRHYGVDAW